MKQRLMKISPERLGEIFYYAKLTIITNILINDNLKYKNKKGDKLL